MERNRIHTEPNPQYQQKRKSMCVWGGEANHTVVFDTEKCWMFGLNCYTSLWSTATNIEYCRIPLVFSILFSGTIVLKYYIRWSRPDKILETFLLTAYFFTQ